MAFDNGPCSSQFEDWEQAYKDWENKDSKADEALAHAAVLSGIAASACAAVILGGISTVPCVLATAAALEADRQSVVASNARNAAAAASNSSKTAYENCVEAHKGYYNPGG